MPIRHRVLVYGSVSAFLLLLEVFSGSGNGWISVCALGFIIFIFELVNYMSEREYEKNRKSIQKYVAKQLNITTDEVAIVKLHEHISIVQVNDNWYHVYQLNQGNYYNLTPIEKDA